MHLLTDLHVQRELPPMTKRAPLWLAGPGERKKIALLGLGDVGMQLAIGLTLLGGDVIEEIGLYDLNEKQCLRLEMELGQIAPPPGGGRVPKIRVLTREELFAGDAFFFCATKAVPALGTGGDVRMAQYEANSKIVSIYADQAAAEGFSGLFGVVSDPVDLLCMSALFAGQRKDGAGLSPDQIQGFGLGVMGARARYYAGKLGIEEFPSQGRVFGPHGKDLVAANSLTDYDDALSRELTDLTVSANLRVRDLGYKPYIAPAYSSGALSILALLRGQYHYGAGYLNGLFFGALSRMTPEGRQWELSPLPDPLYARLERAYRNLEAILWKD